MKRYQKIILIILVPLVIYSSVTAMIKWKSAPYPYMYTELQKSHPCEAIRTDIDGRIDEVIDVTDESDVHIKSYSITKVYENRSYSLIYEVNSTNDTYYTGDTRHDSHTLNISLWELDENRETHSHNLDIVYHDVLGYTTISYEGDADKRLYELFLADIKSDVKSCK